MAVAVRGKKRYRLVILNYAVTSPAHTQGRNPGLEFDTGFYLAEYRDVADSGINPLMQCLLYGRNEGRLPKDGKALIPERKLWGGVSRYAQGVTAFGH